MLVLAVSAGPALAQTAGAETAAIQDAARRFSAAYMRGDTDALNALYTDDAVIFPERSDAIAGRAAIRQYWAPAPGQRIIRHQLTPTRVVVEGRHAYDHGTYEIAGERNGKTWGPYRGKYIVVWRQEPDGWKMLLDMWNSGPKPGT